MLLVAEVDQRVQPVDGLGHHIAATPAIAAVRTAVFDELFPPERDRSVAARARADLHASQIEKLHRCGLLGWRASTTSSSPAQGGACGRASGEPLEIGPGRHGRAAGHAESLGIAEILETRVGQHPRGDRIVLEHRSEQRA